MRTSGLALSLGLLLLVIYSSDWTNFPIRTLPRSSKTRTSRDVIFLQEHKYARRGITLYQGNDNGKSADPDCHRLSFPVVRVDIDSNNVWGHCLASFSGKGLVALANMVEMIVPGIHHLRVLEKLGGAACLRNANECQHRTRSKEIVPFQVGNNIIVFLLFRQFVLVGCRQLQSTRIIAFSLFFGSVDLKILAVTLIGEVAPVEGQFPVASEHYRSRHNNGHHRT